MILRFAGKVKNEMEGFLFGFLTLMCMTSAMSSPAGSYNRTVSCREVNPLLPRFSIGMMFPRHPVNGSHESICSNEHSTSCCTLEMERELKTHVKDKFKSLLCHNSRSVEGVLLETTRMLEDHMVELFRQSENRTRTFFRQVYQTMAVLSTEPIRKLYSDIISQGIQNRNRVDVTLPLDMAVLNFFTDLFPLVYHQIVNPRLRDYSVDYKKCLRGTILQIKPFGEVPKELGEKIGKTMKAVKVFLDALEIGTDVLNQTDSLFNSKTSDKCHTELLRMSFCPKCKGLTAKPCAGYCLNVLRGCLTQFSSQLDLPWSGYVDSLQQLVTSFHRNEDDYRSSSSVGLIADLEDLVKTLDSKIPNGVMEAMQNGKELEEKVKRLCGAPQWDDDDDQPVPVDRIYTTQEWIHSEPANVKVRPYFEGKRVSKKLKESQDILSKQLHNFLSSISKTRGFYANMAESLCSDESFAETRDTTDCWNGEKIGEYTKPILSASVSAQKYNPEVQFSSEVDVSHLSDKLRGIKQVILGVVAPLPESVDQYMNDGRQYEGSGRSPIPDDDDDKDPGEEIGEGSGADASGDGPTDPDERINTIHTDSLDVTKPKKTSGSERHLTSWSLLISIWVCRRYIHHYLLG